jgi:hypothetical protein
MGFHPIAELLVDTSAALVYEEGWQSWSPTGLYAADELAVSRILDAGSPPACGRLRSLSANTARWLRSTPTGSSRAPTPAGTGSSVCSSSTSRSPEATAYLDRVHRTFTEWGVD